MGSKRRRRYRPGHEPWLLREYGGAPMWLVISSLGLVGLIVGYALLSSPL